MMADTRTAITCPKHPSCVVLIDSCPKSELAGRKRVDMPMWADPWVKHIIPRVVVAYHHTPSDPDPDVLLTSAVEDERDHESLRRQITALRAELETLRLENAKAEADMLAQVYRLEAFVVRRKRWHKEWEKTNGSVEKP